LATRSAVLVVVDAVDGAGRSTSALIERVRAQRSALPILAICSPSASGSSAVLEAARAGVSGLIFRGVDDSRFVIRQAIRSATQGSVTRRIYERVSPVVAAGLQPFLRYAISRASDDPSVDEAAKTLKVDRKTLLNRLQANGEVSPRQFLNWIRLAIAIGLLEDGGYTVHRAALEAGFTSPSSFRNMLKRYTGASCADCRARGTFDRVLSTFLERLGMRRADPAPIEMDEPAATREWSASEGRRVGPGEATRARA
jgi:AraC-like DNA-binding protein